MPGYHLYDIPQGELGQFSKVIEEFTEFADAVFQDCSIMEIVELSDLIGSIKHYFYDNDNKFLWDHTICHLLQLKNKPLYVDYHDLKENFELTLDVKNDNHWQRLSYLIIEIDQYIRSYNLTIRDLIRMNYVTERAFLSGQRQTK